MTDVERVKVYEKDHKPDGFPAVDMALLTRLADTIELQADNLLSMSKERDQAWEDKRELKSQLDNAINAYDGCSVERDDLREKLDAAIKDAASWKKCFEKSIDDHARTAEKLARAKKYADELSGATECQADFDEEWKRQVEEGGA